MQFTAAAVDGAFFIRPDLQTDERGFFTRLYCPVEMLAANIPFDARQTSLSRNTAAYTLRGMHYAREPEAKIVRCVSGRIYDVLLDLRPQSPTYLKWAAAELDAASAAAFYVPPGVAHGFLTLVPGTDVLYQIDRIYRPGFDAGVRWNDPAFAIAWPEPPAVISARDANYPDYSR
jgi:dTDP-4-dehydrorhamnose 3,5-epimerase